MSTSSSPYDEYLDDPPEGEWVEDMLPECSRRSIPLSADEEGPLSATLVRYDGELGAHAAEGEPLAPVLHIHGWTDYFYNLPKARQWALWGRRFYALDLRKYGRSLRSWHTPGYISDLAEYDAEIGAALAIIAEAHPDAPAPLLHAHSTGGLIAALWAQRHPHSLSALILNSPWLELSGDVPARATIEGLLTPLSHLNPRRPLKIPKIDNYWQSLSDEARGEWHLHPRMRPRNSFPITAGWMRAVMAGHRRIADGLDLELPLLVLLSTSTVYRRQWSSEHLTADAVLDVDLLAKRAVRLGRRVTVLRQRGALHDVFASEETVRTASFEEVRRWLLAYAPEVRSDSAPTASTAAP